MNKTENAKTVSYRQPCYTTKSQSSPPHVVFLLSNKVNEQIETELSQQNKKIVSSN